MKDRVYIIYISFVSTNAVYAPNDHHLLIEHDVAAFLTKEETEEWIKTNGADYVEKIIREYAVCGGVHPHKCDEYCLEDCEITNDDCQPECRGDVVVSSVKLDYKTLIIGNIVRSKCFAVNQAW